MTRKLFILTFLLLLGFISTASAIGITIEKDAYYLIYAKNAPTTCITENNDGSMTSLAFDSTHCCFWQLIATGNADCYYIRNAVTGDYIQSTKITSSSAVSTGTTPVEFYLGLCQVSGAATYGYYYLCSTDNTGYATISTANLGLNRNGSDSKIVAYAAGTGNANSFWTLKKTAFTYEIHPFEPSDSLGRADYTYTVSTRSGRLLTHNTDGTLSLAQKVANAHQAWYFVGKSNGNTGYEIASASLTDETVNRTDDKTTLSKTASPTWWYVHSKSIGSVTYYFFRPKAMKDSVGTALTVDGDSLFLFRQAPSSYAQHTQIYSLPCGAATTMKLKKTDVSGEEVLKTLHYAPSTLPTTWYTIYTDQQATVSRGKPFTLSLTLSSAPSGHEAFAYFDFDRDGQFETVDTLTAAQTMTSTITVPASASLGHSRMRIRVTDNGMADAEDDVSGETVDFLLEVAEPQTDRTVTVAVNSDVRGTATLSEVAASYSYGHSLTAKATPLGTSTFVCWKEGRTVLSTSANYTFTVDHNTDLVACFSPNMLSSDTLGIREIGTIARNFTYDITHTPGTLTVLTDATVKAVYVFTPDGALVASSRNKTVKLPREGRGTYIVRVCTPLSDSGRTITIK